MDSWQVCRGESTRGGREELGEKKQGGREELDSGVTVEFLLKEGHSADGLLGHLALSGLYRPS